MALLSIDSGDETGWAFFPTFGDPVGEPNRLYACGITKGDAPVFPRYPCASLSTIVEIPHKGKGKAKKGDIITLAFRAGLAAGTYGAPWRAIPANVWKGTAPKSVFARRILKALTPAELATLKRVLSTLAKTYHDDVIDAVGLGLWACGRLPKGGPRG